MSPCIHDPGLIPNASRAACPDAADKACELVATRLVGATAPITAVQMLVS